MTANPNTENFKNYNSYRKHLHDQFLKDARCNLLKHKADLEFQNISLNHLYNQLIPLSKNTKIPDLEIQPNTKTKSQQEIVDLVQSFYKNLYSSTSIDENIASKFLRKNVTKLTPQQIADLEKPITLKELYHTITIMKKGKTPGLGGLSLELYSNLLSRHQAPLT